jgi:hypothetical protein
MDSLFSLLAMEAAGVIDAEIMVKGVVLIAVCFSFMIFLRESKLGLHLQNFIISQLSHPILSHYRMYDRERSSLVYSHLILVQVICQPCAPRLVHRPAIHKLAFGHRS